MRDWIRRLLDLRRHYRETRAQAVTGLGRAGMSHPTSWWDRLLCEYWILRIALLVLSRRRRA